MIHHHLMKLKMVTSHGLRLKRLYIENYYMPVNIILVSRDRKVDLFVD